MNQYETKNLLSNFQTSKRKEKVLKKKKKKKKKQARKKKEIQRFPLYFWTAKSVQPMNAILPPSHNSSVAPILTAYPLICVL